MPPSRRGTGFVNLQQYLGLNASGAQQLGEGLGQQVSSQGRMAQNAIDAAGMEARNRALAGVPDPGGTYSGPASFGDAADVGGLTTQVAEAQKAARAASDQSGRAELLAKKYGPSTWGGGQLDSALAGAGGGAQSLANASDGVNRLSQYLGDTGAGVNAFIATQRGATNAPQVTSGTPGAPYVPPTTQRERPATPNQNKQDYLDKYGRGRP